MLCITHAAVGGAVGAFIANPVLAFGAGVFTHFVVDKVPHFWPTKKDNQGTQMIVDAVGSSLILSVLLYIFGFTSPIFWGAAGGVAVDLVLVIFAGIYKPLKESVVRIWHEKRQPHKSNPVYLFTDVLQTSIGLLIIYLIGR